MVKNLPIITSTRFVYLLSMACLHMSWVHAFVYVNKVESPRHQYNNFLGGHSIFVEPYKYMVCSAAVTDPRQRGTVYFWNANDMVNPSPRPVFQARDDVLPIGFNQSTWSSTFHGATMAYKDDVLLISATGTNTRRYRHAYIYAYDISRGAAIVLRIFKAHTPAYPNTRDEFGTAMAFAGDHLLVGAPLHNGTTTDKGMVYVYRVTNPGFSLSAFSVIGPPAACTGRWGNRVFADVVAQNGYIILGCLGGGFRIYEVNDDVILFPEKTSLPIDSSTSAFVSVQGRTSILIPSEDVFVTMTRTGFKWYQRSNSRRYDIWNMTKVDLPTTGYTRAECRYLAFDRDMLAVGCPTYTVAAYGTPATGAVFVYQWNRLNGSLNLFAEVLPPALPFVLNRTETFLFGTSVELNIPYVYVGSRGYNPRYDPTSSVYNRTTYRRDGAYFTYNLMTASTSPSPSSTVSSSASPVPSPSSNPRPTESYVPPPQTTRTPRPLPSPSASVQPPSLPPSVAELPKAGNVSTEFLSRNPSHLLWRKTECGTYSPDSFEVQFVALSEHRPTDPLNASRASSVQQVSLLDASYQVLQNGLKKRFSFTTTFNGSTIEMDVQMQDADARRQFAGAVFDVRAGTNKVSVTILNWPFVSTANVLRLHLAFIPSATITTAHVQRNLVQKTETGVFSYASTNSTVTLSTRVELNGQIAGTDVLGLAWTSQTAVLSFPSAARIVYDPDFTSLFSGNGKDGSCEQGTGGGQSYRMFAVLVVAGVLVMLSLGAVVACVVRKRKHAQSDRAFERARTATDSTLVGRGSIAP